MVRHDSGATTLQDMEFMARKRGRPRKDAGGSASLIDWQEPESNAHVLDWRERAHEFGLMPVGDSDEGEHVVLPPDRLIDEDDVEAYEGRRSSAGAEEEENEDDRRERPDEEGRFEAGVSREDLDLVSGSCSPPSRSRRSDAASRMRAASSRRSLERSRVR